MLKEVFRTVPIPYSIFDFRGTHNREKLMWLNGLHVGKLPAGEIAGDGNPDSYTSIYLWAEFEFGFVGGHEAYFRFDGKSGKLIRRIGEGDVGSIGGLTTQGKFKTSRGGTAYLVDIFGDNLYKLSLGGTASALIGDEPDELNYWDVVAEGETVTGVLVPIKGYPISRFEPYNAQGSKLFGYGVAGTFALDDIDDSYLDCSGNILRVFTWREGKFRYEILLPSLGVAICLQDKSRCYIFMSNRTVMLFDYERGEVLGVGRIPPSIAGKNYWNNRDVVFSWDDTYRRILIAEQVPDNPDGSCATRVRGYRFVESPNRITKPIPLRVPRKGRTIPVLVKVVNEMNAGIGGFAIDCTISGDGSLIGVPLTTHDGEAFIQVACEGDDQVDEDCIVGHITVTAKVKLVVPSTPISGVPGAPPSGTPPPQTQPDPGGGGGGGDGGGGGGGGPTPPYVPPPSGDTANVPPAQGANMMGVLQRVLDGGAPNGKPWNLSDANKLNADGQGGFMEAAVTAMHDQDANFGHLAKNPGQTQYNGHAVDATVYKRANGAGLESIDVITSRGELAWQYNYYYGSQSKWYYPA